MGGQSDAKLNSLLKAWVPCSVVTPKWLERHGVYRQLADRYVSSGWLVRLERGAYVRAGEQIDWLGGIHGLQVCDELDIHPGGVSALAVLGYGHHVAGEKEVVWLFGPPRTKLPAWFASHDWKVDVRYRSTALFEDNAAGLTQRKVEGLYLRVAAPERAMLEVLREVPQEISVSDAMALMTGLTTVRPAAAQQLLQTCQSVKAKRLFLLMAESAGHRWLNKIERTGVDLGSGKRVLGDGGHYYASYQVSLPESLAPDGGTT